jgi:hypothetical protein
MHRDGQQLYLKNYPVSMFYSHTVTSLPYSGLLRTLLYTNRDMGVGGPDPISQVLSRLRGAAAEDLERAWLFSRARCDGLTARLWLSR